MDILHYNDLYVWNRWNNIALQIQSFCSTEIGKIVPMLFNDKRAIHHILYLDNNLLNKN